MRSAVTGGSGTVGSALIAHLVESGHQVKALARSRDAEEVVVGLGATPVPGDVRDADSVGELVSGCDVVFHVAGVNELCPRDPKRMWEVNVEGTRVVVDAARRKGVGRLVHTSSAVAVSGSEESSGLPRSYVSEYQRSKVRAEEVASDEAGDVELVVVNPSSVQGPGRATGTGALFLSAARGRLKVVTNTTFSLVDVRDCARGHLLAAERGRPGERYLLSGVTLTMPEAIRLLKEVAGADVSPRYLPSMVTSIAGRLGDLWALVSRRPPLFCSETARVMTQEHRYDGGKATRDLGLEYTDVTQTLADTIAWYRQEGLLGNHS